MATISNCKINYLLSDNEICYGSNVNLILSLSKSGDEPPLPQLPPKHKITGFSKIRDIIQNGVFELIVLGWFTPTGEEERPVIAKVHFSSNASGSAVSISYPHYFKDLTEYDIDINEASLESFNVSDSSSNIAIKTSSKIVYIHPLLLDEEASISDSSAIEYPFALTDETYWTNTVYYDGIYSLITIIDSANLSSMSRNSVLRCDHEDCYDEYGNVDDVYNYTEEIYSKDHTTKSMESVSKSALRFNDIYWNGYMYWWRYNQNSAASSYSESTYNVNDYGYGKKTVSRDIYTEDDVYDPGLNYFTNTYSFSLPDDDYSENVCGGAPTKICYSFTNGAVPTGESLDVDGINLDENFISIRPDVVFGNGYIATGSRSVYPTYYQWSDVSGYYLPSINGNYESYNGGYVNVRSESFHYIRGQAVTGTLDFYKVPFSNANIKKLQWGDDWVSLGTVAISASFDYIVTDMPEAYGIPAAIVGDRCLTPIESPAEDEYGNLYVIEGEFSMDDNKVETRPIAFP